MRDAGFFCGIGEVLALLHLAPRTDRPEILDAVYTVDATDGFLERCWILEVSAHHFYALTREFLSDVAAGIAGERAKFPALWKHVADDRTSLSPGRSRDQNDHVLVGHS